MPILVTGAAGFIGYHLSKTLLERQDHVVGIDNLNQYYDVNLKLARLKNLEEFSNFTFIKADISQYEVISKLFAEYRFEKVAHLAAQAGVRYSVENPAAYIESNLVGFYNILEMCRLNHVNHLLYASTSSVYGANKKLPYLEEDHSDHPVSLYAATKKSNEILAHSYASLFQLPCTGVRFFTVYGPWGRPDMALFKFVKNILEDEPIELFNFGEMVRDFTYIDDIIEATILLLDQTAQPHPEWNAYQPNPSISYAPYRIYNIGNSHSVTLNTFIDEIERVLEKKAIKRLLPIQPGDVPSTLSDTSALIKSTQFKPRTNVREGIERFVRWYLEYFQSSDLGRTPSLCSRT